jgi:hypothetical protein
MEDRLGIVGLSKQDKTWNLAKKRGVATKLLIGVH